MPALTLVPSSHKFTVIVKPSQAMRSILSRHSHFRPKVAIIEKLNQGRMGFVPSSEDCGSWEVCYDNDFSSATSPTQTNTPISISSHPPFLNQQPPSHPLPSPPIPSQNPFITPPSQPSLPYYYNPIHLYRKYHTKPELLLQQKTPYPLLPIWKPKPLARSSTVQHHKITRRRMVDKLPIYDIDVRCLRPYWRLLDLHH